jgi:hypothetical protein
MKVYLIRTPGYNRESYTKVYNFLDQIKGEIEFEKIEDSISKTSTKESNALSFKALFSICEKFRKSNIKIKNEDFVVLLTNIKNSKEWFSSFETNRNNIFIYTEEWEDYTEGADSVYALSHQVMENIIQSLIKLDIENEVHGKLDALTVGCINDFCDNKRNFINKFKGRPFCYECETKTRETVSLQIFNQAIEIFEKVRNAANSRLKNMIFKIHIDEKGKITLPDCGNLEFKLEKGFGKTLYLFFLSNTDGTKVKDLPEHKDKFVRIYMQLTGASATVAHDKMSILTCADGVVFNEKVTKVNKKIREIMSQYSTDAYEIRGKRNENYKINLDTSLIISRFL